MLNQKQFDRWKILIRDCKSRQRNINVGGKAVREMLIALDEFVTAQQTVAVDGALCTCKLPGFDANEICKCPTCGEPHRH